MCPCFAFLKKQKFKKRKAKIEDNICLDQITNPPPPPTPPTTPQDSELDFELL